MRILLISACCVVLAGAGQVSAQRVFLEPATGEIPGCVTSQGFEEHHPVSVFDSQVDVPFDDNGSVAGVRTHRPLHFLKPVDCSSPTWRRYQGEGRPIDELRFKFTQRDKEGQEVIFFEIRVNDVKIVSIRDVWPLDATHARESPTGEEIGLTFRTICWSFLDGSYEQCDNWSEPPLSVALVYFDAIPDGADVHLQWGVAALETVTGYEVLHRPRNNSDFHSLTYVDAIHEEGLTEYQTTISNLEYGTHAFRLKEIKFDGSVDYSPVIEVDVQTSSLLYRLTGPFPNPAVETADLSLVIGRGQRVEVSLFDMLGRQTTVLHDGFLEGERAHSFRLQMPNSLAAGVYAIRVVGEDFHTNRTLLHVR
jgi:type VI secretion system Hcp family effector